jgi:hypothetical protein
MKFVLQYILEAVPDFLLNHQSEACGLSSDLSVTSSYTEPLDYGVGFPTSRLSFPGYFPFRCFTTYKRAAP